jgi:hypothetical protein
MIKGLGGAAASITFAIAAAVGVSGCEGDAEADAKKPAASAKAPSFSAASKAFQDVAGTAYLDDVCTQEGRDVLGHDEHHR